MWAWPAATRRSSQAFCTAGTASASSAFRSASAIPWRKRNWRPISRRNPTNAGGRGPVEDLHSQRTFLENGRPPAAGFLPDGIPKPLGRLQNSVSRRGAIASNPGDGHECRRPGLQRCQRASRGQRRGLISLRARQDRDAWSWQGELRWKTGEVFWQPFYGKGEDHRLTVRGAMDSRQFSVERGTARLAGVGEVEFSGAVGRPGGKLTDFEVHGEKLDLPGLHRQVLKPLLDQTAFSELALTGTMTLSWRYRGGRSESFRLALRDAGVEDGRKRFALCRVARFLVRGTRAGGPPESGRCSNGAGNPRAVYRRASAFRPKALL